MDRTWTAIVAYGHRIWIKTFSNYVAAENWAIDVDFDECDGEASLRIIRTDAIDNDPEPLVPVRRALHERTSA